MSNRKKKNVKDRLSSTLGAVAVLLVVVMISGVCISVFPRSQEKNEELFGNPELIPKPEPFGGTELMELNFENIEYSNSGALLYKNNINSSLYGAPTAYANVTDNRFILSLGKDEEGLNSDMHVGFGIPSNQEVCYDVTNIDYLTIDVDYEVEDISREFQIYTRFRNGSDIVEPSITSLYVRQHPTYGTVSISTSQTGTNYVFNTSFHLTYVFKFNREKPQLSQVAIYVDGEYLYSGTCDLTVTELCTIRAHFKYCDFPKDGTVCVEHVSFYTFGNGDGTYDGALAELFGDTPINLTDCKDSILYDK